MDVFNSSYKLIQRLFYIIYRKFFSFLVTLIETHNRHGSRKRSRRMPSTTNSGTQQGFWDIASTLMKATF